MPHEDFFEATRIEFTCWEDDSEKILLAFDSFENIPKYLVTELNNTSPEITLYGKQWKVIDIDKDLRAHGKGIHVRVRLERK